MSTHFRTQINLLNTEALELLNDRKEFPIPARLEGQSDKEYQRAIKSVLRDLDDEEDEISKISTQLTDVEDKWSGLRSSMTGNERIQDNVEYDEFVVTVPFAKTLSNLRRYLRSLRNQRRQLESSIPIIENTTPPTTSLIHLPKTELPTFNGDCVSFLSFWNTFKAGVHDLPISDSIKFTYLKQCLTGSPLTLISALPVTDESYSSALELLRKNYDNPNEVARSLHNTLRKLPHVRAGDYFCSDLRSLLDQLEGICVQMSQRNQSYNTTSFQMEVEERLPRFVLDEIFKAKEEDSEWNSLKLKEKLHHILKRKEQIESLTISSNSTPKHNRLPPSPSFSKPPQFSKTPNNIPTLTFHLQKDRPNRISSKPNTTPRWPCLFCESTSHNSVNCETFQTLKARREKLQTLGRCFKCFKPGHFYSQCPNPSQCSNCRGPHPRALCPTLSTRSTYHIRSPQQSGTHETGQFRSSTFRVSPHPVNAVSLPHSPAPIPLSQIAPSSPQPLQTNLSSAKTVPGNKSLILLKCVRVTIFNPISPAQKREVILLMDDASTHSYINTSEAKAINLNLTQNSIKLGVFNSPSCKVITAFSTQFGIRLANGRSLIVTANTVEHLTQATNYVPFSPQLLSYPELISGTKIVYPSILLGSDHYYEVEPTPLLRLPSGHHLIHTLFGPIVAGKGYVSRTMVQPRLTNFANRYTAETPTNDFFTLEGIGINDSPNPEKDEVLNKFNKEIKMVDSRYQVKLPFKAPPEAIQLPSNFGLCWGRLRSVYSSLMKNKDFLFKYHNIIKEQLKLGIIEIVENPREFFPPLHYLPHHPVIKASNGNVRIVYDGSARTGRELSLNECLHPGPVILPDLIGLILRFRIPKIAIISDIAKAFLQVSVDPSNRDSTRFLWLKNPESPPSQSNLLIYRFTRVSFGLAPSPFLLAATIQHHLSLFPSPLSTEIAPNTYVDNIFLSAEDPKEGQIKATNAIDLFKKASMRLQEFVSNSSETISHLPEDFKSSGPNQKFLGIEWQTDTDTLIIQALSPPSTYTSISKRAILTFMASHFDPLGLISPAILPIKIFLQSLWHEKVDWDKNLSSQSITEWNVLTQNWVTNSYISIPRRTSQLPSLDCTYQLHCFTDASNQAMCAAVYLRTSNPSASEVSLIFCKTKVKPINKPNVLTIPRLELIAALMGSRALKFILSQLTSVEIHKNLFLWCDSTAVISWLNAKTPIKDIFVQNRINEIRKLPNLIVNHLPGIDNPADIGSRGVPSIDALNKLPLWWRGPNWLSLSQAYWPSVERIKPYFSNEHELKIPKTVETPIFTFNTQLNAQETLIDLTRFSRLPKLLRILSYIQRFINSTKNRPKPSSSQIGVKEIQKSLKLIIRIEQKLYPPTNQEYEFLGIYNDPCHLLRCKGRLGKSQLSQDTKELIYLPPSSHLTCLIIFETHLLNHHSSPLFTLSIIRRQFWIPKGRRATEKAIHKCCLPCRRFIARPFNLPPFPHFPTDRVEPSAPFSAVGLDFCGPLYIKTPFLVPHQKKITKHDNKKYWIAVWVCLATRALSLDLIPDLTIDSFSLAFRRQTAKFGGPKTIHCDNAPTFNAAHSFLSDQANISPPVWHFRAPSAAWKGGHYERLIALVKFHLKRALSGGAIPRTFLFHEVSTILLEIETIINSRPITYDSSNPSDLRPLCPFNFLRSYSNISPFNFSSTNEEKVDDPDYNPIPLSNKQSLNILWEKLSARTKAFWTRWKADYILSLRERHKKLKSITQRWPIVNELVLVYSETLPRSQWSLAVIKEIYYTEANFPNTAKIKFISGHISLRSVHHLFPLETTDEINSHDRNQVDRTNEKQTISQEAIPNTLQLRNRTVTRQ